MHIRPDPGGPAISNNSPMDSRIAILVLGMMLAASSGLRAQETTVIDGPAVKLDEPAKSRTGAPLPAFMAPYGNALYRNPLPPLLTVDDFRETKDQRAFRLNKAAYFDVMSATDQYLRNYRIGMLPSVWDQTLSLSRLFLSAPLSVPFGYVPMMNQSNYFAISLIPGWAPDPDADKYSPENIPQCVKLEYDFATGTYKRVMVDWETVVKNQQNFTPGNRYLNSPPPKVPLNNVERRVFGM